MTPQEKYESFMRLQLRFVERLRRERAELQGLLAELPGHQGQLALDTLAALGRIAHGLAGAAGTFGFHSVGDMACGLDRCMKHDRVAIESGCIRQAIQRLLQSLDEACAAGLASRTIPR